MRGTNWISPLFWFAALYDGVLGLAFLLVPTRLFAAFEVTPPNHLGYVHFPAALLLIFALLFVAIARAPLAGRQLIIYGILLKVAYCLVAGGHWATTDIPVMWKPFVIIDFIMGVLFVWAYWALAQQPRAPVTE
jgi:hypothetical protein